MTIITPSISAIVIPGQNVDETAFRDWGLQVEASCQSNTAATRAGIVGALGYTPREGLTAARTYYVRTDGSDTNDGKADNAGGAFSTLQKAANVIYGTLDLSGFNVTVQVRPGTYTAGVAQVSPQVGAGEIVFTGNSASPGQIVLAPSSGNCFYVAGAATSLSVSGMKLTGPSNGLNAALGGVIKIIGAMEYGAVSSVHLYAETGGTISDVSHSHYITGGAFAHVFAIYGGLVISAVNSYAIIGSPTMAAYFAFAGSNGTIYTFSNTFSGAVTAQRYLATANGVIQTNGGGASYFPGTSAGATTAGGQYA